VKVGQRPHDPIDEAIERQLQRGIELAPMDQVPPGRAPSTAELDAMFGVFTGPAPLAEAARPGATRSPDLKERMRAAFAADLPTRRAELASAMAVRDREAAARVLHGLRGSAGYLGEVELNQLCGELEQAADAGDWARLSAALPQLSALLSAFQETAV